MVLGGLCFESQLFTSHEISYSLVDAEDMEEVFGNVITQYKIDRKMDHEEVQFQLR
jgi:hypothetical protein